MEAASAIADPIRREILEFLRAGPASAGEIASRFTVSRPAISRHLRVLRQSDLVVDQLVGRQRLYTLNTAPLTEIVDWISTLQARDEWEQRLDALETEVARTRRQRRPGTPAEHNEQETA